MERKHILFVEGMRGEACVEHISKELDNTRVDYTVSLGSGSVTIIGDNDALHAAKIAINKAGYIIK